MRLTDRTCKSAKPKDRVYRLWDGGGLYLEVTPTGGTYWRLKYRYGDKEKRLALGVYPLLGLADARGFREAAKKQLANGVDPSHAKRERRRLTVINAENTFETVAREWHGLRKDRWSDGHAQDILHRLEKDVFPTLGARAIADITAPQVLEVIRRIEKRKAHEIARRTTQYCSQIFRYAVVTSRAERDPAADLKGALQPVKHTHYATIETRELPELIRTIERNDARLFTQTRIALRLLMLTFVRTNELIAAMWDEINFAEREWVIPPARMKMRRTHVVPLSKQTVTLLEELRALTGRADWIFPNQAHPRRHMSNNTILGALRRLGYRGRMTGHGFRALAMTTLKEKLGYRHEVVDRQLAHAPRNKIDAAYDRALFLDERKKMMQHWADYIDAVVSDSNVVVGNFGRAGT